VLGGFVTLFVAVAVFGGKVGQPLRSLTLPLNYTAAIRAAAAREGVEPALLAAVIYAETRFRPRTSTTGAVGPMQIEPTTAAFIARGAGFADPTAGRLADPTVNIDFGSWYLRYLIDRFRSLPAALAAYNAGARAVERWEARARRGGRPFGLADITFAQTRAYVAEVLAARETYADTYADQLGGR